MDTGNQMAKEQMEKKMNDDLRAKQAKQKYAEERDLDPITLKPLTVTPEMIEAGLCRLEELRQADVDSAYLVREVFVAMYRVGQRSS